MIYGKYCIHSIEDLKGYKILCLNQARSPEGCISRDLCFLSVSLEPPLLPNLRFHVLASAVFKVCDEKQLKESWRSTDKYIILYTTRCLL